MKSHIFIFLLALIGLAGACKKEEPVVLLPTTFSIQVSYLKTGQPVDSALFIIGGVKGSYLQPPITSKELFQGRTDAKGFLAGSIDIPSDYYAYFDCYIFKLVNNRRYVLGKTQVTPDVDELKRGKDNKLVILLDTLR